MGVVEKLQIYDSLYNAMSFLGGKIMEQYLNNLIEQFRLATGSKNVDSKSAQFINEFSDWIKSCQSMGEEYTYFLDYMGFRFADADCAEVGKGDYDSVVKPFETTIITSATPIKKVNSDRIIKGNMRVYESVPVLVRDYKGGNQLEQIPSDIIRTYMTQNPFTSSSFLGWENLHNSGENNIILGIYGSIYDKDIEARIKQLNSLKDKLTCGDYKEDYSVFNGSYFYAIGSDRRVKKIYKKTR